MVVNKWSVECLKLIRAFLSDRITATVFVDKYIDLWRDKTVQGKTEKIDPKDYVKDPALLSSIFLHCDTHESMHGADGGYTDEELKTVVAIFLDADDVESGYKAIEKIGLDK